MTWTLRPFLLVLLLLAACQPAPEDPGLIVVLVADGRELTFQIPSPITVEAFLERAEIEWEERDRINPPPFTQISDGMRITVVRVDENTECETEAIPYETRVVLNEGLAPGEERLQQRGQNGEAEICYRITLNDGEEVNRAPIGQPTVLTEPRDEILFVGPDDEIEPVPITGTLAYINNDNAWVMSGNSTTKRPLTTTGNLDSLVFTLSPEGRYLLYTARPADEDAFVNELWLIDTRSEAAPVQLVPTDVLHAEWVPGIENTISYTAAEIAQAAPFWKALNNFMEMRIDPQSGASMSITEIVPESSGGLSGWWGTLFTWSPDGERLAWVRADGVGLVNLNTGELEPLLEYATFRTRQPWSWRASVSWSWDAERLATTVHGPPLGSEPADTSPVFDVIVTDAAGSFNAKLVDSAGMWSAPRYSPQLPDPTSPFPRGYLAYLQAREPYESINGEYDLVVADRDGSNARVIFPDPEQAGIRTQDFGLTAQDFTWSPDGQHIALIYQGDLWVVDVASTVAHRLTLDGRSTHPTWGP